MLRSRSSSVVPIACAGVVIAPLILAQWVSVPGPAIVRPLALAVWGVAATLWFERWLFSDSLRGASRFIGLARSRPWVLLVAFLVTIPMWVSLPLYCRLNGIAVSMRPDWPAILLGVVLVNGIAEEVIHRGFVFNHLRSSYSFGRAAAIASAVFAAQHLYLVLTIGWIPGLGSVVLAALLTLPLAYAFESGGKSIVAPAILHTGSNAPMLIYVSPEGPLTDILVPYMGVVLLSMYGLLLMRRFPHRAVPL